MLLIACFILNNYLVINTRIVQGNYDSISVDADISGTVGTYEEIAVFNR